MIQYEIKTSPPGLVGIVITITFSGYFVYIFSTLFNSLLLFQIPTYILSLNWDVMATYILVFVGEFNSKWNDANNADNNINFIKIQDFINLLHIFVAFSILSLEMFRFYKHSLEFRDHNLSHDALWMDMHFYLFSSWRHQISGAKQENHNDPFVTNGLFKTMTPLQFEEVVEVSNSGISYMSLTYT